MLTKERAFELLVPDFEAGKLYWGMNHGRRIKLGDRAGSIGPLGYWVIRIDRQNYRLHRVLWFMYYGEWPKHHVDHIDCNQRNNSITNLRDVTHRVNASNRKRQSKTGVTGVFPNGNKYIAKISLNSEQRYLGTFDTIEAASAAYTKEKNNVYPDNS